jgi:hypothetical protein
MEILASLGILLLLSRALHRTTISLPTYAGVLLVVLAIGETTRRSTTVSKAFFISLWRLRKWSLSQFFPLFFFLVTIVFIIASGGLITVGLQSSLGTDPPFAQDLFVSVLTIVAGAIAIFFAGAALIVELIWGNYSSLFVHAFVRHRIFLFSLVLMILVAVGNLLPLRFGWNKSLATASLVSAVYVIMCMGMLVWLLIRFLQAPLVVREASSQILAYIRRNLPRSRLSWRQLRDGPSVYYRLLDKLRITFEFHILGRYPRPSLYLAIPTEFSEGLQERTRPVFSACLRAITEDRRDIALACLDSIVAVGASYLDARHNYVLPDDPFTSFLFSQLEILFNAALHEENEQFTTDIVEATSKIGQASLPITEPQVFNQTNRVARRCSDSLAKFCLRSLPLKHTSAPVAACEGITQIGRGLLAEGTFNTALFGAASDLAEIGQRTAAIKREWPSVIAQKAIHGLVLMLYDLFSLAVEKEYYLPHAGRTLCDALGSITRAAFAQKRGFDAYATISAPLVGNLWLSGNVVDVFRQVLQASCDGPKSRRYRLVSDAIPIVKLIHTAGLEAISHCASSGDYSSALSAMAWYTIQVLKDQQDPDLAREAKRLLRELLRAAYDYGRGVMEKMPNMMFEHLQYLSPIYAFMVYFAWHNNSQVLVDELCVAIKELSDLLSELVKSDRGTPGYRKFYSYMKMYAAWIHKYFPRRPIVTKLLHSLASNVPPEVDIPEFIMPQTERLGYPSMLASDSWYIFPSRHWSGFQQPIADELNDLENYKAFDALLRNLRVSRDEANHGRRDRSKARQGASSCGQQASCLIWRQFRTLWRAFRRVRKYIARAR